MVSLITAVPVVTEVSFLEVALLEGALLDQSEIAAGKIEAYRSTHYRVGSGESAFSLKIGSRSEELLRLYKLTGLDCGLFITAFNPHGEEQSDEANAAAHAQLGQDLRATFQHVKEGAGADPSGTWPEEKSYFALGVDGQHARELGNHFLQDAVVWTGPDAIPRLLLLR